MTRFSASCKLRLDLLGSNSDHLSGLWLSAGSIFDLRRDAVVDTKSLILLLLLKKASLELFLLLRLVFFHLLLKISRILLLPCFLIIEDLHGISFEEVTLVVA
jgi:hypothetical protein